MKIFAHTHRHSFFTVLFLVCALVVVTSLFTLSHTQRVQAQDTTAPSTHWNMPGGNQERTSWVSTPVNDNGTYGVVWARPIEAYIDQKTQIVSSDNDASDRIFLSTTRGVYAFRASNGDTLWTYNTSLPIGNSPTIKNGAVYFGAYDKKLHALRETDGTTIWDSPQAEAGFSTNPLVVSDSFTNGRSIVISGNRDGRMYAVDTANPSSFTWQYPPSNQMPLGPIKFSAAYKDGVVYFGSTDMHVYALNVNDGSLRWKSEIIPGERLESWWPVVLGDHIIIQTSLGYRNGANPGTSTFNFGDYVNELEEFNFYGADATSLKYSGLSVTSDGSQGWPSGTLLWDSTNNATTMPISQYFSIYPYRPTAFALSRSNGQATAMPFLYSGTKAGTRYPAVINPAEQAAYLLNNYSTNGSGIPRSKLMGWKWGNAFLKRTSTDNAIDEPLAFSGAGTSMYSNLCCDREARNLTTGTTFWPYQTNSLSTIIPGYDQMWQMYDGGGESRLWYFYGGGNTTYNRNNGYYSGHGNQNPLVPYKNMLFTHKGNAVVAIGANGTRMGSSRQILPALQINTTNLRDSVTTPSSEALTQRLDVEIQKIIDVWHTAPTNDRFLRPAYYNSGVDPNGQQAELKYFDSPGDNLDVLSRAYLRLTNPTLRNELKAYLADYYQTYFGSTNTTVSRMGWQRGTQREYGQLPEDIRTNSRFTSLGNTTGFLTRNLYALYSYANIFDPVTERTSIQNIYSLAQTKLPSTCPATTPRVETPYAYNECIAGYFGYLKLQDLLGIARTASTQTALNTLLSTRTSTFSKDFPNSAQRYDRRFNAARNFMFIVPELGEYWRTNANSTIDAALKEYNYLAPFWFVSANDNTIQEGVMHHLHDQWLFLARAYVSGYSREQLYPFLDTPAFERGDLFYIQNLTAMLDVTSGTSNQLPVSSFTANPVNGAPPLFITADGSASYDADGTIASHTWDFGDGAVAAGATATHTYSLSGTYTIRHTVTDNLGATGFTQRTVVVAQQPAGISNITSNATTYPNGQIPRYEKFELTFDVNSIVPDLNPYLPYFDVAADPDEPTYPIPGLDEYANKGITVNVEFRNPEGLTFTTPAFYYQNFDYQAVSSTRDWIYPQDSYVWKARFSPNETGTWSYIIRVQDANGTVASSSQNFSVINSTNKGFIRVSTSDPRYFEYDNGERFVGLGYDYTFNQMDPIQGNQAAFNRMKNNNIDLARFWLSQWSVYGSAWAPLHSHKYNYPNGSYLPYQPLTAAEKAPGSDVSARLAVGDIDCVFYGWLSPQIALKQNTTYKVRIRYKTQNMGDAELAGNNHGLVMKYGDWMWDDNDITKRCDYPGVGQVISPYVTTNTANTANEWQILEGTINNGNGRFMSNLYFVLENMTAGLANIDYVWLQEDLGGGNLGANLIYKPDMDYHLTYDQRDSYAFDKVLENAENSDVALKVVLLEKDDWIAQILGPDGTFNTNPNGINPLNFYGNGQNRPGGGSARDFTKGKWLQQAYWRYVQARWGYSTSIHSWELTNEGDPGSRPHFILADELGKFMRCGVFSQHLNWGDGVRCSYSHPNNHITTTSTWHSLPEYWTNASYPNLSYADIHQYIPNTGTLSNMIGGSYSNFFDSAMGNYSLSQHPQLAGKGKPIVRGETGFTTAGSSPPTTLLANDTRGVWLHNFLWSQVNSGALHELYWYVNEHFTPNSNDRTPMFKPLYKFISEEPLNNGHYTEIGATITGSNNIKVLGQKDLTANRAFVWLYNTKYTWCNIVGSGVCSAAQTITPESGSIQLSGFRANQPFTLETWNTWTAWTSSRTQQIASTSAVIANNSGTITLPIANLSEDAAYKLIANGTPVPTPTPTPSPTASATPVPTSSASPTSTPTPTPTPTSTATPTPSSSPTPSSTPTPTPNPTNQSPIASFNAAPTVGNVPFPVLFNGRDSHDPDGSIISYAWSFGDGSTSSNSRVVHVYRRAGIFTVTLVVTDNQGASAQSSTTITVNPRVSTGNTTKVLGVSTSMIKEWLEKLPFISFNTDEPKPVLMKLTFISANGDPLANKELRIHGTGVFTDAQGYAEIRMLPGTYNLLLVNEGKTVESYGKVKLQKVETQSIKLKKSVILSNK